MTKKIESPPCDLESFLQRLEKERELCIIEEEVNPDLELAEIHRRVVTEGGKALLFKRVKNSPFPVVTNLFGTKKRTLLAFPNKPEVTIDQLVDLLSSMPPTPKTIWNERKNIFRLFHMGTKKQRKGAVCERKMSPAALGKLPFIRTWPEDGGSFLTLPLVYTEDPQKKLPK